jgi:hypothetical protein
MIPSPDNEYVPQRPNQLLYLMPDVGVWRNDGSSDHVSDEAIDMPTAVTIICRLSEPWLPPSGRQLVCSTMTIWLRETLDEA